MISPNSKLTGNVLGYDEWQRQLREALPKMVKKQMESGLADVVEKCIANTPPFPAGSKDGGSSEGLKTGMENLESEVNKVFKPVKDLMFRDVVATRNWEAIASYNFKFRNPELQKALQNKKIDALENAFRLKATGLRAKAQIEMTPTQATHFSQRGKNGRIVPNNTVFYVKNEQAIKDYVNRGLMSVGKMVGGWYLALAKLGRARKSPYPAAGSGDASSTGNGLNIVVEARNDLGNFNGMLVADMNVQAEVNKVATECVASFNAAMQSAKANYGAAQQAAAQANTSPVNDYIV